MEQEQRLQVAKQGQDQKREVGQRSPKKKENLSLFDLVESAELEHK
jgi:hypothetical protein